jgi:putative aminopeptidase FrvX
MKRSIVWLFVLSLVPTLSRAEVAPDLESLMDAMSVSGREEEAAQVVIERVGDVRAERDRLGNVVVTLGEGAPRRLVACGLDEAGFAVTEIREDGYLRMRPTAWGAGALWAQGFEGQKVWIATRSGRVAGALATPSTHLSQDAGPRDEPFVPGDAYLDVGASNEEEVRAQGIEMLDTVARYVRRTNYGDGLVAGPAAQTKAACAAQLSAARTLAAGEVRGTLVLAWTRLDRWNRKGIEYLVMERGPFDEVLLASRQFGLKLGEAGLELAELPALGSGPMHDGEVALPGPGSEVSHVPLRGAAFTGGPDWQEAAVGHFAVPAIYRESQVETVSMADVEALSAALVEWGGGDSDSMPAPAATAPDAGKSSSGHEAAAGLLAELIDAYGVSGHEEAVRAAVTARLPEWAESRVDDRGNLIVEFGAGEEHVAFVAHLDEVGLVVGDILEDGRLELEGRGGFSPSLWEAQSALVHTAAGAVAGVFEPRPGWFSAESRRPPGALTVYLGTNTRQETLDQGVALGDSVTSPKKMERLGAHRAVARGFDDRVGSTAQLLALERLDPKAINRRVTFAWVVEEEVGLFGSVAMGRDMPDIDRVHAVDTFVSSDDPYPRPGFARTLLGDGVVLRAMDNSYIADRATIDYVREVAANHSIPTQVGFTGGGNDGTAFIGNGATNMPLSWPGRSSHSPAEIMDLRDLESLVDLIVALVED